MWPFSKRPAPDTGRVTVDAIPGAVASDADILRHALATAAQAAPAHVRERLDGWGSALSGIGAVGVDKRISMMFTGQVTNVVENAELWRMDDLAARIVETLPSEMLREGISLNIDDDDPGAQDKIKQITAKWEDLGMVQALWQALCYERAYGGAAIILGCNDLRDMADPLDDESITDIKWLEVFEPLELTARTWQNDPNMPGFGWPLTYQLNPIATGGSKESGMIIHASRAVVFHGIRVSRRQLAAQAGWGDAHLTRCREPLRDFQTAWSAAGVLVHDFAQAVFKIKGLAEIISLGKDEELRNRIRAIELSRSVARAVIIDAESEEFSREQTPLSGLPEILTQYGSRLAASADMPVTKLMGTSPGGLGSTGDGEARNWFDYVKGQQVRKVRPPVERILKIIMRALKIQEPKNWSVEFPPLWQPTEAEQATARFTQMQTDVGYAGISALSAMEIRNSRFGGYKYSFDTKLDSSLRVMPVIDPPPPNALTPKPGDPQTDRLSLGGIAPALSPNNSVTAAPINVSTTNSPTRLS